MFGETTISHVEIGNHPIEITIYKWLFGVPGRYVFFGMFLHLHGILLHYDALCISSRLVRTHMKESYRINVYREMLKKGQLEEILKTPVSRFRLFGTIGRFGTSASGGASKTKMEDQHSISTSSSLCHSLKNRNFERYP